MKLIKNRLHAGHEANIRGKGKQFTSLQRYNTENSKQIFPEKEMRGHSPNFHIRVSVSDLYIPTMDLPILLKVNMWTDRENMYKSLTDT
jgi:hypothetical protein